MELFECIENRRSIRKYTEQPIEFDKITKILNAGLYAPSTGNLQNWRFVLVLEKPLIKKLYHHCMKQEQVYHAQAVIVVCGVTDKAERMYGLRGKRLYTIQNCACAIQNMLLAAHALGIGACWVGAFDEDKVNALIGVPDRARPQAIITLGYPAEEPKSDRKSLEAATYFNSYGMKIKHLHMFLRDYSVEWERRFNKTKETGERQYRTIKEKIKDWWQKGQQGKMRSVLEKRDDKK
ncbi:MAG: nitroreductase family protein [archaeon]